MWNGVCFHVCCRVSALAREPQESPHEGEIFLPEACSLSFPHYSPGAGVSALLTWGYSWWISSPLVWGGVGTALLTSACVWYTYHGTRKTLSSIEDPTKPVHLLSSYRASLMLTTCLAILAVDFPFFDRELAKTEAFGFSLVSVHSLDCNIFRMGLFFFFVVVRSCVHACDSITSSPCSSNWRGVCQEMNVHGWVCSRL